MLIKWGEMKRYLYIGGIAVALVTLFSCSSVDRNVKILYSDSELKGSNIYTIVVFPPTLPTYLEGWVDTKKTTAEIWQIFHTELRNEVMLLLADPQKVWLEILNWESTPKEWMFSGNRETAWKVANNLRADGFILLTIEEWKEGGLNAATVSMRCTLIRTKDNSTLLELKETANTQTDQAEMSTKELALEVSHDMAKKVLKSMRTGQASKALHISPRIGMGIGLIAAGLGTGFASMHAHNLAEESYERYRSADNAVELEKFKGMTQAYDDMSTLLGIGSLGFLTTGVAVIFTGSDSYTLRITPALIMPEENTLWFSIRFDF